MIYLSGAIRPELHHPQIGWMCTPKMGNRLPDHGWWAADNGCFSNPTGFSWDEYERWLTPRQERHGDRLLFATYPDVPFDSDGTLARFDQYRSRMRQFHRRALVTQDGMHPEDIRWDDIEALFVGGTTEWKTGPESLELCTEAKRRGLWVHMGRVNSFDRMRTALKMGCDSADGTYIAFGPELNTPNVIRWVNELNVTRLLPLESINA